MRLTLSTFHLGVSVLPYAYGQLNTIAFLIREHGGKRTRLSPGPRKTTLRECNEVIRWLRKSGDRIRTSY